VVDVPRVFLYPARANSAVHPAVDHGSETPRGQQRPRAGGEVAEKFVRAVYEVNFQWTTPPE
jgi:hypothetical protein